MAMEFETWEPIYERIVRDFEYDPATDRQARDLLADFVTPFDFDRLDFENRAVAIAGGSQILDEELDRVRTADRVIAVSNAAAVLDRADTRPDLVVTDLDKTPETAISLSRRGVPVAVHAHGDNMDAVREFLPRFELTNVFGTTQVEPTDQVVNFGGFTDGDRAAFLADHLGAAHLTFPGWNFDDHTVSPEKQRKLLWAARLLLCLERRRDEQFAVLDGWRTDIEEFPDGVVWDCVE